MKVHFPLTGFNLSGGVRVVTSIANGLVNRGYEVLITVPSYRSTPPFTLDDKVEVQVIGDSGTNRLGYVRKAIDHSARWGDVLVATNFKTPHILRKSIQRNAAKSKILYLIQGYEPYTQGTLFEGPFWRRWVNRRMALKSYDKADYRCYVSKGIAAKVGLDPEPCLVHPGLNHAVFYPDSEASRDDRVHIGFIARAGRLKGSSVFFEAASKIRDLHPKIKWLILRVGEIEGRIPSDAEVLTAHNDLEVANFYRRLDLFTVASFYEGFGLPALEAMACGAAVVTTDLDGIREFAVDGTNASIVPIDDSDALASALGNLVRSSELRARYREAGIETAAKFTWDRTVDQFEEALSRTVDS